MDAQIALGGILPTGGAPADPADTAEDIPGCFYRASGQLKPRGTAGAKAPPPGSEEKEFLAIRSMDLRTAPAKPRPRVEEPVGDNIFASFGLS